MKTTPSDHRNEPQSAPAAPVASATLSYGQLAEQQQPHGEPPASLGSVADGLRNGTANRPAGKPGRSGPPGNSNARKTGAVTVRRERKELRRAAMDGRRSEALFVAGERADLIADLGGEASVSTQRRWLVEEAAFLRLELAFIRTFLAEHPPINKKKRIAHPILRDYLTVANTLRSILGEIGLERRTREVPDLQSYLAARQPDPPPSAAPAADTDAAVDATDAAEASTESEADQ